MILSDGLQYWDDLSLEFMTEESDDEDDFNCIIEHKLPWHSTGMSIILVTVYNVCILASCIIPLSHSMSLVV